MGDGGRAFEYVGALDGLRALAVLAVLVFHADLGVAPGGFLGVSVFFTLSGFLITGLLLHEHGSTGRIDLRAFYERRARRLLPAAHVCVAAVLASGAWWAATQRRDLPGDAIAAVANVANWRFAFAAHTYQDLFIGEPSPLAHFWSLAIEEQCYLLLPLVAAWALRRGSPRRLGWWLAVLLAGSLGATWLTTDANLVYHGTHTRAAELLLGALLAVWVRRLPAGGRVGQAVGALVSLAGLTTLTVLFARADLQQRWIYRGGLPLVAVVSAVTVLGLTFRHPLARLLGSRPLTAIGRRSYGIYLFHWPLFLLLSPQRVGLHGWPLFAVRLAATAVVAMVSYRVVEQPVRAASVLRGRRSMAVAGVGAATVLVWAATWAVPAPAFTRTEALLALGDDGPITFGASGAPTPVEVAPTTVPPAPPRVLVVGSDPDAAPILRLGGFEVVDGSQPVCPAAQAVAARLPDLSVVDLSGCAPVASTWPGLLQANSPDVVVLGLGDVDAALLRTAADPEFPAPDDVPNTARLLAAAEQSLRASVAVLDAAEVPVVFWDRVVMGGERPIQRLALSASPPRAVHHTAEALVAAVGAAAGGVDAAPMRVLVVGDSTSLDMAQSLADAADGHLLVRWAGANGCPLVAATATRSGSDVAWQPSACPDYAATVPGLVAEFRPDAVLVVMGPTELQEHQYAGDPAGHVAGDPAFVAVHHDAVAALVRAVGTTPLLFTDGPAVRAGPWATPQMAAPERLAAWNQQLAGWDAEFEGLTVVPYAAALAEYEFAHGSIRPDGVHPTVEALTDLVSGWLLPRLDALAAPAAPAVALPPVEALTGDVGASAEPAAGPLRVMVIGDSTSLVAARALADGADGRLEVRWAGQEGCPFVPAVAARPASSSPWRTLVCRDVAAELPRLMHEYRPQVVLLVVGAMELMEQRYAADGPPVLPGGAEYRTAHDRQLEAVMATLRAWRVPLLVADTPVLGVGSYSTFEMADPARADAFNLMIGEWAAENADVRVLPYGGPISDFEVVHGSIRPDGSHPLLEQLTGIARSTLVPSLVGLAVSR